MGLTVSTVVDIWELIGETQPFTGLYLLSVHFHCCITTQDGKHMPPRLGYYVFTANLSRYGRQSLSRVVEEEVPVIDIRIAKRAMLKQVRFATAPRTHMNSTAL